MNDKFRVPKHAILAEIVLPGSPPVYLHIFLGERAKGHAGSERPSDLLNRPETFLPTMDPEGKVIFLNRESLIAVSIDAEAEYGGEAPRAEDLAPDQATRLLVEITLEGGNRARGTLMYVMPEARRRVQDVLNLPEPFLTLRVGDKAMMINRRRIVRVTPMEDEGNQECRSSTSSSSGYSR